MILISFTLALIAIVYGAKLLAQSQKENLGGLYKYIAWFVMIVAFIVLLCDTAHGFMGMCHRCDDGGRMMGGRCMMMDGNCDGMMECSPMWMMYHQRGGCCNGMMNCYDGGNCGNGNMMNCKDDGKGGSCNASGMNGGSCTMSGGMKDKADTAKAKK